MMEDELDEADNLIRDLVAAGAIDTMVDPETGETLYRFNENIETLIPSLWEEHQKEIQRMLYIFWDKGIVNITFSEEGPMEDTVSITDKAFDIEVLSTLSDVEYQYLRSLIMVFTEDVSG